MRDQLQEFVIAGLEKRRGEWKEISDATGISTKTMSRMVNAENTNNRRDTLIALADHFKKNPAKAAGVAGRA